MGNMSRLLCLTITLSCRLQVPEFPANTVNYLIASEKQLVCKYCSIALATKPFSFLVDGIKHINFLTHYMDLPCPAPL